MKQNIFSIRRVIAAFGYSLEGLKACYKSEAAFRQEVILFIIGSISLLFLPIRTEIELLMLTTLFLMLIAELVNCAVETTIDRISTEMHPLSKKAKDVGSAAVLLTLVLTAIVWAYGLSTLL